MESIANNQTSSVNSNDFRDEQLWEIAKKRVAFKASLAAYVFVNSLLVIVWFFTARYNQFFWPIWPILGWGLGISFQYISAYHSTRVFSAEHEYEKLKQKLNK